MSDYQNLTEGVDMADGTTSFLNLYTHQWGLPEEYPLFRFSIHSTYIPSSWPVPPADMYVCMYVLSSYCPNFLSP